MAIPLIYNLRSVRQRWTSAIVAVLGIAGTVGVFVAMLAMADGFRATLVASGARDNAIVRRAGATSEMESALDLDQVRIIENGPGVARDGSGPIVSAEVVVVANFPLRQSGTDANVQVRGVSARGPSTSVRRQGDRGADVPAGCGRARRGQERRGSYAGFDVGSR